MDLRGLKQTTHVLNQLTSLEYYLGTSHNPMSDLTPTIRGPILPPIQNHKRRSINTGMIVVVVGELGQWKISIPTPAEIRHGCSDHIFERMYSLITLSIGMGVVCCAKMQLSTQLLIKFPPKSGGEANISIRNH